MVRWLSTIVRHKKLIRVFIILLVMCPFLLQLYSYRVKRNKERAEQARAQKYLEDALARIDCDVTPGMDEAKFINEVKNNRSVLIPPKAMLRRLNHEQLAFLYHRYIENLQYFCYKIDRLGEIRDGGWDVCDESKFRPKPPCVVYSFGINNDFTFDDSAIDEYGCEVHSFDPSMGVKDFHRRSLNYFYNLGIASNDTITNNGWEVLRYSSIKERLGHQEKRYQ